MKFQSLEQFREHEYGAGPGRVTQIAIAILGGVATVSAVFGLLHLGA
jgi:hypothetical protein